MEISLSGRSAIITGGSKGIGLAVATRFAQSGADVAIFARGKEALDEAVAAIKRPAKARVIGVQADVGVAADIQRGYDEVMKAFGKVDIIVNNAGTSRAIRSRASCQSDESSSQEEGTRSTPSNLRVYSCTAASPRVRTS